MTLSNQRVLVTGAGVVRALLDTGAAVHATVRPEGKLWRLHDIEPQIALHRLDIDDEVAVGRTIRHIRPDLCIHLAVPGGHPSDS
ncbi:MAG: NAD-dependent epimerase/dehydratase family protein [candidate division Zixibacteria bacterium]|nr:NAD-dependent epimerase/dehydratase family protein [candidate division Zixibacteria bacterium]